ncbi:SdpI family protein [Flavobacterium notoginsengisoli]
MKNKSNWDFAQKFSTNLFLILLTVLLLLQIILYLIFGSTTFTNFSVFIGLIISVAIVLYQTEKKLKQSKTSE